MNTLNREQCTLASLVGRKTRLYSFTFIHLADGLQMGTVLILSTLAKTAQDMPDLPVVRCHPTFHQMRLQGPGHFLRINPGNHLFSTVGQSAVPLVFL